MKKKLLIINKVQFSYHTDSYKYCQNLKNEFDITYICFDTNETKIIETGIEVLYVPHKGSFIIRGINFIKFCRKYIRDNQIDLIFAVYFQMVFLLKLSLPFHRFILDIRTGSVSQDIKKRKMYDRIMRFESLFFKHITIISECLRVKLKLKKQKCHILPLGADPLSETDKSFTSMHLLYVGTLNSRNIDETVKGFSIFLSMLNQSGLDITYDIFGNGTKEMEMLLKDTIKDENLEKVVKFHGRKTHEQLKSHFNQCNVGVSYVPITDYFQCQPPTKTFEYIMSGLVCIGTNTEENKKLINSKNGVLCENTPESFAQSLKQLYMHKNTYQSYSIKKTLSEYTWNNIIRKKLKPYINEIIYD